MLLVLQPLHQQALPLLPVLKDSTGGLLGGIRQTPW